MSEKAIILDGNGITRAIARISYEIIERNKGVDDLVVIGIYTRGTTLANRIADKIGEIENTTVPRGFLDITLFRDDNKASPEYKDKTTLDFDISGKRIILVDDVMYTGRTVRAAIDALMEIGRSQSIQLAVLIDRGHRELPIRADYIGKNLPTSREEKVSVLLDENDCSNKVIIY